MGVSAAGERPFLLALFRERVDAGVLLRDPGEAAPRLLCLAIGALPGFGVEARDSAKTLRLGSRDGGARDRVEVRAAGDALEMADRRRERFLRPHEARRAQRERDGARG